MASQCDDFLVSRRPSNYCRFSSILLGGGGENYDRGHGCNYQNMMTVIGRVTCAPKVNIPHVVFY